jgi:hypothetical protein
LTHVNSVIHITRSIGSATLSFSFRDPLSGEGNLWAAVTKQHSSDREIVLLTYERLQVQRGADSLFDSIGEYPGPLSVSRAPL